MIANQSVLLGGGVKEECCWTRDRTQSADSRRRRSWKASGRVWIKNYRISEKQESSRTERRRAQKAEWRGSSGECIRVFSLIFQAGVYLGIFKGIETLSTSQRKISQQIAVRYAKRGKYESFNPYIWLAEKSDQSQAQKIIVKTRTVKSIWVTAWLLHEFPRLHTVFWG